MHYCLDVPRLLFRTELSASGFKYAAHTQQDQVHENLLHYPVWVPAEKSIQVPSILELSKHYLDARSVNVETGYLLG